MLVAVPAAVAAAAAPQRLEEMVGLGLRQVRMRRPIRVVVVVVVVLAREATVAVPAAPALSSLATPAQNNFSREALSQRSAAIRSISSFTKE